MKRQCCGAFVIALLASSNCLAGDDVRSKLGKLPELRLAPRPARTEEQTKKVKELIAGLAKLDKPDFGLSATLTGVAFSPLPDQARAHGFVFTDHGVKQSDGLKALVAMGPDALPFLLESLDDETPTKLKISHDFGFGAMWHSSELPMNPVNPAETATHKSRTARAASGKDGDEGPFSGTFGGVGPRRPINDSKAYTLKVGDVCFVAIGQIVGRNYQAVRYQPSACVVLNCPTHSAILCTEVREIWKSEDAVNKLFDSLLADYATEGTLRDDFQCTAALRLLYYFPKESARLIAGRLDKLDVSKDVEPGDYMRRFRANGVASEEFIGSVNWCRDDDVRAALVRLFKLAQHPPSLLATIPAVDDRALIRKRLEPLVADLPADGHGPYGSGYELLLALGVRTPDTVKPIYQAYLKNANAERCYTMCRVLQRVEVDFDVELLAPMLSDDRSTGWAVGKPDEDTKIRVCDGAALALSRHHPEFKFTDDASQKERAKQIALIREQIGRKK